MSTSEHNRTRYVNLFLKFFCAYLLAKKIIPILFFIPNNLFTLDFIPPLSFPNFCFLFIFLNFPALGIPKYLTQKPKAVGATASCRDARTTPRVLHVEGQLDGKYWKTVH